MAKVTAQQWLDNWSAGLSSASTKIKAGIARVTTAPGQKAASKADKMLAGVTAAVTSGKWANAVGSVSLADWQSATSNKVGNIATGAQNAKTSQKTAQAITQMLADNDAAVAAIANLPSDTLQDRIQRSIAFMQTRAQIAQQRGK